VTALVLTQAPPATPAVGSTQLVVAALLGIAVIVLLITYLDVHSFLALIAGAAVLGRSWCWWRGGCGCRSSRWGSRHSRGCRCCTGSSHPTRVRWSRSTRWGRTRA
jgi:hypothetical protein